MTQADHSAASPPHTKRTPDWLLFFSKFLRHGVAISSFVPSSPYLSRAVLSDIDWARSRCIVELGAGTGPVSKEILAVAPPSCRTILLERDPDFCVRLRDRFPTAEVVEADAADLERFLDERGIERVDHFVCGLPLHSFPRELRESILDVVFRRLSPNGTFRQLTHLPYVYYQLYRCYFEQVSYHFVLRNLPPAGYYLCRAPRPQSVEHPTAQ